VRLGSVHKKTPAEAGVSCNEKMLLWHYLALKFYVLDKERGDSAAVVYAVECGSYDVVDAALGVLTIPKAGPFRNGVG
jgi:hypothetical protein